MEAVSALDEALKQQLYPSESEDLSPTKRNLLFIALAAEDRFGVRREWLVYGLLSLFGVYLMMGAMAQLACNVSAFAYPAYASLVALRTVSKDDDTQWLTYWTVFALFSLCDFFADRVMSVLPLYWLFKCAFLVYLYAPATRGAEHFYRHRLEPLIAAHFPVDDGGLQQPAADD